jgi:SAM-dependent methyltransferase
MQPTESHMTNTLHQFDKSICDEICVELSGRSGYLEGDHAAQDIVNRFFELRSRRASGAGLFISTNVAVDRLLHTTRPEYLDLPEYSEEKKNRMVNFLHIINLLGTYRSFFAKVEPYLQDFLSDAKTPARVLELASGSGEFILDAAVRAKKKNLTLQATGSDYFDENVIKGNQKAMTRGVPVRFEKINIFELGSIADDSYDFVFITQALHHFTLEQLATIIGQASRIATYGVFALDGRRSMLSLLLLAVAGVIGSVYTRTFALAHDAVVSALKFFIPSLLELTLKTAAPGCTVKVRPASLVHIFIEVRRARAP